MIRAVRAIVLLCSCIGPAHAQDPSLPAIPPILLPGTAAAPAMPPGQRNGLEIYERFRDGLADPECDAAATGGRWKQQFGHAPGRLIRSDDDLLPLFGYVVDALREAHLPTEYALIPFVESGYRPGARNAQGPAGLWQFIAITARNHKVPMREGYDGRLSAVDSTRAAVRYLKTLHGMFAGDWRLAVMAYNAGEYRVLQSLRKAGMNARNANPAELPGLSGITYAYVEKLHALACIFQQADDREEWLERLDRPVPRLAAHPLPPNASSLERWARDHGHDVDLLRRLNPVLAGNFSRVGSLHVLAPARDPGEAATMMDAPTLAVATAVGATTIATTVADAPSPAALTHTVSKGESAWTIARRYGLKPQQLLAENGLKTDSTLRPGMVLKVGAAAIASGSVETPVAK